MSLQQLSVAQVHMHPAWQAGVETSYCTHDVYALELVWAILFENWRILHRILVRPGRSVNVARIGIPRRRRIWMIVRDLAVADHYVMRQHAANRFVEAAADCILWHGEFRPRSSPSRVQFSQRLLHKVKCHRGRVNLEVGPSAIPLNGIAPLWNFPFELYFRQ